MSASKTTPGSTTVKVSTNTGAAKDDIFTGLNEDNATTNFNVLANDPGSAKIWSLDQNALNALAGSQQPQALSAYTLASGAKISLNLDGSVRYDGAQAMQKLAEGEIFNDSFIYTIRMANGALSTAKATVAITGVNDAATFSGDTSGMLIEDASGASGSLVVSDIDHDQSAMQAGVKAGAFGALNINASGAWTYERTSDMNYLAAGESVTDSITVNALDGTAQDIAVTIAGVNDVAVFGGTAAGTVQEDGALTASGLVTVSDLDHDQSAIASTGALVGTYGNFTFDLDSGAWTYALRNADSNVQALNSGAVVQDKLVLASVDGTASEIVVTIGGQNEVVIVPEPVNTSVKWTANPQNVTKEGGGLQSRYNDGAQGVAKLVGFDSNDTLHTSSLTRDTPFIQQIDTDGIGGVDSSLVNLSAGSTHLDIVLVGYLGFTEAQLFLN